VGESGLMVSFGVMECEGMGSLLHAVLSGVDEGEDVIVGAFEDTF
jgi:hypothetical protein